MNQLYYGDNLNVLREHIKDESVDLIYLDPPFNSQASYNVLFKSRKGDFSEAQIKAFDDTWHWGQQAEDAYHDITQGRNKRASVAHMVIALRAFLGENDMMAYLVNMAVRLVELHRVLKPTGSLYLHCDPTASHYLKIVLDGVFGPDCFRNELVWKRTSAHSDAKRYGSNSDRIHYYTKSKTYSFARQHVPFTEEYESRFRNTDPDGRRWADYDLSAKGLSGGGYEYEFNGVKNLWRCPIDTMERLRDEGRLHFTKTGGVRVKRYLDELPGLPCQEVWDDIPPINSQAKERLGYPTQKPVALLERIILSSSNPGDIVLDPFCGCGTALHAAQKLNRQWIGIDITHLAISLIENRLRSAFPEIHFDVHGTPKDLDGAKRLAEDPYQFQWWALSLVNAMPLGDKKKGADRGIDGVIFVTPAQRKTYKIVVSVKAGAHVGVSMVRDLKGVLDRESSPVGIFITLAEPTKPMLQEAAAAGFWETDFAKYPRIQIMTIHELLEGKRPALPGVDMGMWKKPRTEDSQPLLDGMGE